MCSVRALGLALLAAVLAPLPIVGQTADKVTVHQGYPSKVAAFWPNYVAAQKGFYARQGVEVDDVIVDPNVTVSALIGGSVDLSYADATQLFLALEKGANLVAVGLGTDRQPYHLMAAPGVKSVADLKGKKIGVASAIDIYTYVVKQILRKGGLDPEKDVDWVVGGGQNQRVSALIGGAIQAGLASPPSDTRLRDLGFTSLAFTPDLYPNLTLSQTTVRRDWAEQHPDVLRKVLRAQLDAVRWLNNPANKAEALQLLETTINAKPTEAEAAYAYYIGQHVWPDACVHQPGLVNTVKIMDETKQLARITPADVAKVADTRYCPK
jgi:NitT/TauT family transport system substrate-binding protein